MRVEPCFEIREAAYEQARGGVTPPAFFKLLFSFSAPLAHAALFTPARTQHYLPLGPLFIELNPPIRCSRGQ